MAELSKRHFRPIDRQFALFLRRIAPDVPEELVLAAALTSRAVGDGHICLDLATVAGKTLDQAIATLCSLPAKSSEQGENGEEKGLPELGSWLEILTGERAAPVLARGEASPLEPRPLILEGTRLYLQRYHAYEEELARRLVDRGAIDPDWSDEARALAARRLPELFPEASIEEGGFDWQRFAAYLALRRNLLVVTGGPGTGKTTTVARILALLIERHRLLHPDASLRILLAAPTGKAAARVGEAIKKARLAPERLPDGRPSPGALHCDDETRQQIPEGATTLHRLLGTIPDSPYFRHDRLAPLTADVVVVDEVSMVALPLMAKLVEALPPRCKLILLGDMDQLASIEPGRVLGDICAAGRVDAFDLDCSRSYEELGFPPLPSSMGTEPNPLSDCFVKLQHSHRFEHGGPIDRIARAINECRSPDDAEKALRLLEDTARNHPETLQLLPHGPDGSHASDLDELLRRAYRPFTESAEPAEALDALDRFRILCALKSGPSGIDALNRHVASLLGYPSFDRYHDHRPILITRNDHDLKLFNGDVGVILHGRGKDGSSQARAWFRGPDGSLRSFAPPLLPEHQTCFAMTVHKSQGSEFDEVLLLLPHHESPVLTRELVYTAITRARAKIGLCLSETAVSEAFARSRRSTGGLEERLRRRAREGAGHGGRRLDGNAPSPPRL